MTSYIILSSLASSRINLLPTRARGSRLNDVMSAAVTRALGGAELGRMMGGMGELGKNDRGKTVSMDAGC